MLHSTTLLILSLCLFLSSCKGVKTYIIKKGQHESGTHVAVVLKDQIKFQTIFDDSAIYATQNPENQADINKLYGFSDCDSAHHDNSARFGWRWLNSQLEIHAYTYVDGVRASQFIKNVNLNQTHHYQLNITADRYEFILDETTVTMPRGCSTFSIAKYKLYPYFGGDEVAPHDIKIIIAQ